MLIKSKAESRKSKGSRGLWSIYILYSLLFSFSSYAQCAMCRAALGGKGNVEKAQAVNDGIVYLMVIPYLLIAGIGYYIYRMKKK